MRAKEEDRTGTVRGLKSGVNVVFDMNCYAKGHGLGLLGNWQSLTPYGSGLEFANLSCGLSGNVDSIGVFLSD